jgi:hypothetical protein
LARRVLRPGWTRTVLSKGVVAEGVRMGLVEGLTDEDEDSLEEVEE